MINSLYSCFDHWHNKPGTTVWIISDTHFNDPDIPRSISPEAYLKFINSYIGKKDTLIHLGDVGDLSYASRLKGYKILIKGNHDSGSRNYQDIFQEIYEGPLTIGEKIILSHEPLPSIDWAINLHGHNHSGEYHPDPYHFNFCGEASSYAPINMNKWAKEGHLAHIKSIHRETIDKATRRKR